MAQAGTRGGWQCGGSLSATVRRREGFTVVEVVVSTMILMIITLAVIGAFSFARRSASLTENRLASLHIAREVMEVLRQQSYDAPLLVPGSNKQLPGYPVNRGFYDVVTITGTGTGPMKRIRVVIQWVEPWGQQQAVAIESIQSRALHP